MAIQRKIINYTVYSPNYKPGQGYCTDFRTASKARRIAKNLGMGSRVRRNIEFWNKGDKVHDWWVEKVFEWRGDRFYDITQDKSKGLP
jgi:hypothetical protein